MEYFDVCVCVCFSSENPSVKCPNDRDDFVLKTNRCRERLNQIYTHRVIRQFSFFSIERRKKTQIKVNRFCVIFLRSLFLSGDVAVITFVFI